MGDPPARMEFRRTCPACNRPVSTGDKFCPACGARVPSLVTCSKCGTQFIHPQKYCDLCGAPFVLDEIPQPEEGETREPAIGEAPEAEEGEGQEPEEQEEPEPEVEEEPEPEVEEEPEPEVEEEPEPEEEKEPEPEVDKTREPGGGEIPEPVIGGMKEPDTAELLEKYGREYDEQETLESYQKRKPASFLPKKGKKPAPGSAPQGRDASGTVDDVLFLLDGEPAAKKLRVNKTLIIGGGIALVLIVAAVFFIGLPMLAGNGFSGPFGSILPAKTSPLPEPTVPRTPPATATATLTPSSRALVPQPTQTPPGPKLYFQVQKSPITFKISVTYIGSAGAGSLRTADVRVTHADGSVATGIILPLKGINEIVLDGSEQADRVEINAKMYSGETYHVYDDLLSGRI